MALDSKTGVRVVAVLYLLIGGYNAFEYLSDQYLSELLFAVAGIVGGFGLAFGQRWSQVIVYAVAAYSAYFWIAEVVVPLLANNFRPYGDNPLAYQAFGHGDVFLFLVLPILPIVAAYIVFRHFNSKQTIKQGR